MLKSDIITARNILDDLTRSLWNSYPYDDCRYLRRLDDLML